MMQWPFRPLGPPSDTFETGIHCPDHDLLDRNLTVHMTVPGRHGLAHLADIPGEYLSCRCNVQMHTDAAFTVVLAQECGSLAAE
jgi:hypothetical protein